MGCAGLRESVLKTIGMALAAPEYYGSFSSIMNLVVENLGFPSVLAEKPTALLGVAAGQIGVVKSLEALSCDSVGRTCAQNRPKCDTALDRCQAFRGSSLSDT